MRKFLLPALCVATLSSCTTLKHHPFQNTYQNGPYKIEVAQSKDQVWDKIIDIVSEEGLTLKLLDKASGIMMADETSFLRNSTYEFDKTGLHDTKAAIIHERISFAGQDLKPNRITAQWNIRVKDENGRTTVGINMTNIQAVTERKGDIPIYFQARSTGQFERSIASLLNK